MCAFWPPGPGPQIRGVRMSFSRPCKVLWFQRYFESRDPERLSWLTLLWSTR